MIVYWLVTTSAFAQEAVRASHSIPAPSLKIDALKISESVSERSWKFIVLHHSATRSGSLEAIDAEHRQRLDANGARWLGIGYHFVIGNGQGMADGQVQPTFRWREQLQGAHAGSAAHNELGIGICLIGNFEEAGPTPAQSAALAYLIEQLSKMYSLQRDQILRHGDLKATACPGKLFRMEFTHSSPLVLSGATK